MEEANIGMAAINAANASANAGTNPQDESTNANAINWNDFTSSLFNNLGGIIDSTSNLTNGILANQTAANGGTPPPIIQTGTTTVTPPSPVVTTVPQNNYVPQNGTTKSEAKTNPLMYVGIGIALLLAVGITVILTRTSK